MVEYRLARSAEREAYLALADSVFAGQTGRPFDFASLLPKMYGPGLDTSNRQYLAVDDARGVVGLIASLPGELRAGGMTLRTGYIGTVSVHPKARGEGHMKRLMALNLERLLGEGADLVLLGGQRQRYAYFGFEPAGLAFETVVTRSNVRHALSDVDASGVRFEEITPGGPWESEAAALHRAQRMAFDRPGFATVCVSYGCKPFAAVADGRFVGYVVRESEEGCLCEVAAPDGAALDRLLKAWLQHTQGASVRFPVSPAEPETLRHLWNYAEGIQAGPCVQALVLNWPRVTEALLRVKASYTPLADGELSLEADGRAFAVRVQNGQVSVSPDVKNPLRLTRREAQRMLLDPFAFETRAAAPAGWFPLPLFVPTVDAF